MHSPATPMNKTFCGKMNFTGIKNSFRKMQGKKIWETFFRNSGKKIGTSL